MKFSRSSARRAQSAFTMVEIAIALAVIGFALVAIVGVLPMGMDVQKNNRRETIINQDANYFLEAIRSGARGLDDLTNYVIAITNQQTDIVTGVSHVKGYDLNGSYFDGALTTPVTPLTNGEIIIGLLSTPRYINGYSNYITAYIQALSGDAIEKAPQNNSLIREAAFSYRLMSEIVPYGSVSNTYYDSTWTNYTDPSISGNSGEISARSNYLRVAQNLNTNLFDLRLLFRWPLLPGGKIGNGHQAYRLLLAGAQFKTNLNGANLYFFQPQFFNTPP